MFLSICQEVPIILPALFLPKSMLLLLLFHWIFIFIELPFAISLSTSTKVSFLLLRLWRVTRMTIGTFSTDGFDDGYGNRKWSQTLFRARECHPRFLAAVAAFPSTANRVVWRTGDYGSFRWVFYYPFNWLLVFSFEKQLLIPFLHKFRPVFFRIGLIFLLYLRFFHRCGRHMSVEKHPKWAYFCTWFCLSFPFSFWYITLILFI